MKQNIWVVILVLTAAAAGMALGASCTPQTDCTYIDREVADPLHPTGDDVAYCWQGVDYIGLYTFRFEQTSQDGGTNLLHIVDPPSSLEPAGAELVSTWQLLPDFQAGAAGPVTGLNLPDLGGPVQVEVNRTTMILGDPATSATALRRAVCSGFGYETAQKQCRGSATRP